MYCNCIYITPYTSVSTEITMKIRITFKRKLHFMYPCANKKIVIIINIIFVILSGLQFFYLRTQLLIDKMF